MDQVALEMIPMADKLSGADVFNRHIVGPRNRKMLGRYTQLFLFWISIEDSSIPSLRRCACEELGIMYM